MKSNLRTVLPSLAVTTLCLALLGCAGTMTVDSGGADPGAGTMTVDSGGADPGAAMTGEPVAEKTSHSTTVSTASGGRDCSMHPTATFKVHNSKTGEDFTGLSCDDAKDKVDSEKTKCLCSVGMQSE